LGLDRVCFALPAVEIVRAFNPKVSFLLEKTFKTTKASMLEWAFCRALIIGPLALAIEIRGSAAQVDKFNQNEKFETSSSLEKESFELSSQVKT
jgi:hypothetical protein